MELTVRGVSPLDAERSAELEGCEFSERLVQKLTEIRLDVSIEGENAELIALLGALGVEVAKEAIVHTVKFRVARAGRVRVSYEIETQREATKEVSLEELAAALRG